MSRKVGKNKYVFLSVMQKKYLICKLAHSTDESDTHLFEVLSKVARTLKSPPQYWPSAHQATVPPHLIMLCLALPRTAGNSWNPANGSQNTCTASPRHLFTSESWREIREGARQYHTLTLLMAQRDIRMLAVHVLVNPVLWGSHQIPSKELFK